MDDLTSSEYADWQAFCALEPIGVERGDLNAAMVASTLANINRDAKKKPQGFGYAEFMPFAKQTDAVDSLSERIKNSFRQIGSADV